MAHSYGIDYGMGTTNRDPKTGIRYGVIPMHALSEWAYEDFEADYGDPTCPKCGNEAINVDDQPECNYVNREKYEYARGSCGDYACDSCSYLFDGEDAFGDEPLGHILDDGEYEAMMHSDGDVFVIRSPYYTFAQFCSPCAPGACYLLNPTDKQGPKAFCLGHDWFEGNKAPYPIWRVANDELVKPGE